MVLKKFLSLFSAILVSILFVVSCGANPNPTPNYTPSGEIQEKLQATAQAFGRDIPIPTYLPKGYTITDVQFIQQQYSYDHVDLTITAPNKSDISMQITWYRGPFRILPGRNSKTLDISGGPGTYSKWAVLNHQSDHNDLWWDWIPGTFPASTVAPEYYEIVLSASKDVPDEELINVARLVRIP
jgi:hypothetical protein